MDHNRRVAALCLFTVALLAIHPGVINAETDGITDPETWYAESYGPLWHENSWDKVDEVLDYYHTEVWDHSNEGEAQLLQAKTWIFAAVEEWRADGWTGSEVPDIRVHRINDSTVSFTTRWLDHYNNREDEYSCAWYLADLIGGQWKFTQFAAIDCDAHGF